MKIFLKIKTVYLLIKNKLAIIVNKLFTKPRISKILIIFIIGFTSRMFINYIYNVNVFIDFINCISIIYYLLFSGIIVLVHEIVDSYYIPLGINPHNIKSISDIKQSNILHIKSNDDNISGSSISQEELLRKQKHNEYHRKYRENNRQKCREINRKACQKYYENNKEKRKEHFENNKEKYRESNKKSCKKYYENNKEKRNEYRKKYLESKKGQTIPLDTSSLDASYNNTLPSINDVSMLYVSDSYLNNNLDLPSIPKANTINNGNIYTNNYGNSNNNCANSNNSNKNNNSNI
jgi:hypothetical protein